jgi:hypothetical protein
LNPNPTPPRIPTQQWLDQELAKEGFDPELLEQIGKVESARAASLLLALDGPPCAWHLVDAFLDARDEEYRGTRELAKSVLAMLDLQRDYFKTRRSDALAASKVAERDMRETCRRLIRRPNLGSKD